MIRLNRPQIPFSRKRRKTIHSLETRLITCLNRLYITKIQVYFWRTRSIIPRSITRCRLTRSPLNKYPNMYRFRYKKHSLRVNFQSNKTIIHRKLYLRMNTIKSLSHREIPTLLNLLIIIINRYKITNQIVSRSQQVINKLIAITIWVLLKHVNRKLKVYQTITLIDYFKIKIHDLLYKFILIHLFIINKSL